MSARYCGDAETCSYTLLLLCKLPGSWVARSYRSFHDPSVAWSDTGTSGCFIANREYWQAYVSFADNLQCASSHFQLPKRYDAAQCYNLGLMHVRFGCKVLAPLKPVLCLDSYVLSKGTPEDKQKFAGNMSSVVEIELMSTGC
jgi:hypothetical protein